MTANPAHWAAALDPPRAFGPLPAAGALRTVPEDFQVDEQLGFEPDGEGPHWLLRVRKRGANTQFVAGELGRFARVRAHDVGFAGLKDRNALATQWFTVPRGATSAQEWLALSHPEFQVLEAHAHRRKLRRGALSGNRFRLRVRALAGDLGGLLARVDGVAVRGVPNFFGEQRFGRDGSNLQRAAAWASSGTARGSRQDAGFALSAARSALFNAVLAERVRRGDWDALLPGDVANLAGSGSVFAVAQVDDVLRRRLRDFDLHPTGPMWGAGETMAAGAVRELEAAVVARFGSLAVLLEDAGLRAERRSLRVAVEGLRAQIEADTLELEFSLGAGAFATTVLRELLHTGRGASETGSET